MHDLDNTIYDLDGATSHDPFIGNKRTDGSCWAKSLSLLDLRGYQARGRTRLANSALQTLDPWPKVGEMDTYALLTFSLEVWSIYSLGTLE